jgi:DNA-binding transcriptional regulator YbjK
MAARKTARRVDPQRRERIIEAALEVIGLHGVEGLTHRRVAAVADVPLGSTTYYFASLDDLLAASMAHTIALESGRVGAWLDALPAGEMAGPMARAILSSTTESRARAIVESELYSSAIRRPALRAVAVEWDRQWLDALTPRIGHVAARAVSAVTGGLLQSALLASTPPDVEELEAVLRHVLHEVPPAG